MDKNKKKYCVYLDIELSQWIKSHSANEYRSFSSFLNKLMKEFKDSVENTTPIKNNIRVLKSETRT